MILQIRIEHLKDKTKKLKRVLIAKLETDIPGLEQVNVAAELDNKSGMAKEINDLVEQMLILKKKEKEKKNEWNEKIEKSVNKLIGKK